MSDLEKRINDLEVKFSYQDQLISDLNTIVAEQQRTIDSLIKLVRSLSEKDNLNGESLKDERPPHY